MTSSFSITESQSFTVTHARHMASKVSADLKRMQRFYGSPSDTEIADFEAEMIALLKGGYLDTMTYGFRRDNDWVNPTLRYTARDLQGSSANDDDPGRVVPGADITNARFYSYLTRNANWHALTSGQQAVFEAGVAVKRPGAPAPGVQGYFSPDKTYSAGGQALGRDTVRSW